MKCPRLFALVWLLLVSQAIAVCSVPQPRLVCAEYFASSLVVEATLVRVRVIRDKDDPELISAHVYTLRVNRILRGGTGEVVQVYEGNDSGRATFDWTLSRKYLLFLFYSPADKSWQLDGCGNSGPSSQAKAALSAISEIQAQRGDDGVIHGVVSRQALSDPIPGVHVEARGDGGHYIAATNEKGEFQMRVPAGRYVVRGVESKFLFDTADLSYGNRRRLRVERGGCVQVQLLGVERDALPPQQNH